MNIENAKDGITENSFQVNLTAQVLNTEDILDVSELDKFLEGTELTHNFVPGKVSYMWRGEKGSTPITSGRKVIKGRSLIRISDKVFVDFNDSMLSKMLGAK